MFLHLNGGNDGLNTVIPYQDPRYRALRPSLAVDAGQVRKISETLGLHPGLAGLETLWQRERLAIVNGVGYPQPSYSHFRSTEIWYTAQPERTPVDGWLGRALDAGTSDEPLRAVALGKEAPLSLACASPGVVTMTDFRRFRLPRGMEAAAAAGTRTRTSPAGAARWGRPARRPSTSPTASRSCSPRPARSRVASGTSSARSWPCSGPTSTWSASRSPSAASTRTRPRPLHTTGS